MSFKKALEALRELSGIEEQIFSIGSGGMRELPPPGRVKFKKNTSCYIGASSSPDFMIVTSVNGNRITYVKPSYDFKDEIVGDLKYIEDLIIRGTQKAIDSYGKYRPEEARKLKKWLAGGPPMIEDPRGYESFLVYVQPAKGGMDDNWRDAEEYGNVGGLTTEKYGEVLEIRMRKKDIPELKKDKRFEIIKITSKRLNKLESKSESTERKGLSRIRRGGRKSVVEAQGLPYYKRQYGADKYDVAQAVYWYLADNHGGQNSEGYKALSAMSSYYNPGRSERGPEPGTPAEMVYDDLDDDSAATLAYDMT